MLPLFSAVREGLVRSLRVPQSLFLNGREMLNANLQSGFDRLLTPMTPLVSQACSFKVKARLRRRCKDCYIVVRDQRSYVICPTHPRHKQMALIKKEKYTWILTGASQSKIRPW